MGNALGLTPAEILAEIPSTVADLLGEYNEDHQLDGYDAASVVGRLLQRLAPKVEPPFDAVFMAFGQGLESFGEAADAGQDD